MGLVQSIATTFQGRSEATAKSETVDRNEQGDETPRLDNSQANMPTCRAPCASAHLDASSANNLSRLSNTDWLRVIKALPLESVVSFRHANRETKAIVDWAMTELGRHIICNNSLKKLSKSQLAMELRSPKEDILTFQNSGALLNLYSGALLNQVVMLVSTPSVPEEYKQQAIMLLHQLIDEATDAHQQFTDRRFGYSWHQSQAEKHLAQCAMWSNITGEFSSGLIEEKCQGYEDYNQSALVDVRITTSVASRLIERGRRENASKLIERAKQKSNTAVRLRKTLGVLRAVRNIPSLYHYYVADNIKGIITLTLIPCLLFPLLSRNVAEELTLNLPYALIMPALTTLFSIAAKIYFTCQVSNDCRNENKLDVIASQCELANLEYRLSGDESQWRVSMQASVREVKNILGPWPRSESFYANLVDSVFDLPRRIAEDARSKVTAQVAGEGVTPGEESLQEAEERFEKAFRLSSFLVTDEFTLYADLAKVITVQQCAAAATDCFLNQQYNKASQLDWLAKKFGKRITDRDMKNLAKANVFYEANRAGDFSLAETYLHHVERLPDSMDPLAIHLLLKASVEHEHTAFAEGTRARYNKPLLSKLSSFAFCQSSSSLMAIKRYDPKLCDVFVKQLVLAAKEIANMQAAQPLLRERAIIKWSTQAAETIKNNRYNDPYNDGYEAVLLLLAMVFQASIITQQAAAEDFEEHAAAVKKANQLIEKIPSTPFKAKERAKLVLANALFECVVGPVDARV